MPRPRREPLFELGGQWIAHEPSRPGYYRYWNDAGNGRTRRASLGTSNLEDAKARLADIVIRRAPASQNTHLTLVLERYFVERTDHQAGRKPARHAGKMFLACWGDLIRVSAIDNQKLKDFVDWSVNRGNSLNYIARNLSVLAAAMSHSTLAREIPMKEGALLDKWPDLKPPKRRRKVYEPTDQEIARVLRQHDLPQNLRRWILMSMATLGRPMAVAELSPAQRDRAKGMIALNPEGRRQNKKVRPTLRLPKQMTTWLNEWEGKGAKKVPPDQRYCLYAGRSSIHTVMRRACDENKANVPRFALYSIRHRGTTVLREAMVPKEFIDWQLGHVQAGAQSTRDYGEFPPSYGIQATRALEAWIARVLKLAVQKPQCKHMKAA